MNRRIRNVKWVVTHSCQCSALEIRIPRSRRKAVRLAIWTVLIGIVLANQGYAEDFLAQPLTRLDCDRAEMAWDENANVCVVNSVETRQPLTRLACQTAGMMWNENANVCGTVSEVADSLLHKADGTNATTTKSTSSQPLTKNECDKA